MKRWPREVREALKTKLGPHEIALDPIAKRVGVRSPDGVELRLKIDLIDGFTTPAIIGGVERTRDIVAALAPILGHATCVATRYELAAFALLRHTVERDCDADLRVADTAQSMQACVDSLRRLRRWCRLHADLSEREDAESRAREAYGPDDGDAIAG